jgi:hypothetical protein
MKDLVKQFFVDLNSITAWVDASRIIKYQYSSSPHDFLEFAEKDLSQGMQHSAANSLSNTKRALDYQLDYFFLTYGLSKVMMKEKWSTGKKIKILEDLSIMPARILHKINSARNLLEHSFELPSVVTAENALDIVAMFISAFDMYLYPARVGVQFEIREEKSKITRLSDVITTNAYLNLSISSEDCIISANGKINGLLIDYEVDPLNSINDYYFLLTFILHYHRLEMPECEKFFKKLKYIN